MTNLRQRLEEQSKSQIVLSAGMAQLAKRVYELKTIPVLRLGGPVASSLLLERPWYEREIRVLGEEENLPSLPVFRPPPPFARGLPEPSQEQT